MSIPGNKITAPRTVLNYSVAGWVFASLCNWASRSGYITVGKVGDTLYLNNAKTGERLATVRVEAEEE
jgi:hypothetical protein